MEDHLKPRNHHHHRWRWWLVVVVGVGGWWWVVVVMVGHVTACTTIYKTEQANPSHTLYFAL